MILALSSSHGSEMRSGSCISDCAIAAGPVAPMICTGLWSQRSRPMGSLRFSIAWIPFSRIRRGISFGAAGIELVAGRDEGRPPSMAGPRDLRQWLAGSFCRILRGLPSFWIVWRSPKTTCHSSLFRHEFPF